MENRAVELQEEWIELKQYGIPEGQFVVINYSQDADKTVIGLSSEHYTVEVRLMGFLCYHGEPLQISECVPGVKFS